MRRNLGSVILIKSTVPFQVFRLKKLNYLGTLTNVEVFPKKEDPATPQDLFPFLFITTTLYFINHSTISRKYS
jgi:hypothetical protein